MRYQEIDIWLLLAGLGLFLFGMFMLEEALKALARRSFKKFLRKHTGNRIKAVLSGAMVTAVLQSSSMVSLLVMSFAGAGIIGLSNGIGIILGANLGTTFTGWLVSLIGFKLDIASFIMPFLAIGGLGIIFLKSERLSNLSKFLMGFSFMFLGLSFMQDGFASFADQIDMGFMIGKPIVLFVIMGAALSASIQSSSAAMMIFLSSLATGIINLEQGFYLVIGGDLGTTVTAIIATVNGNAIRKKVGWSQFAFNFITAIVAIIFMPLYIYLIEDVMNIKDQLIGLVAFHSMFNLSGILLILPILPKFASLIDRLVKADSNTQSGFIHQVNPKESHAAVESLRKETVTFFKAAIHVNKVMLRIVPFSGVSDDYYGNLKMYESEITNFSLAMQQAELNTEEAFVLNHLVAAVRNATLACKDMKDIRHNLDELHHAASDSLFVVYTHIQASQLKFYEALDVVFDVDGVIIEEEIEQLSDLQVNMYQEEIRMVQERLESGKQMELDMPTMQNMIREINNSNEAFIRSANNYLLVKDLITR
jgi:phosphate:Na+ symporter